MKQIFFIFITTLLFFIPGSSFAQSTNTTPSNQDSCSQISIINYDQCCTTFRDTIVGGRCQQYTQANLATICQNVSVGSSAYLYNLCCVQNNQQSCRPEGVAGSNSTFGGNTLPQNSSTTTQTTRTNQTSLDTISQECREVIGPTGRIQSLLDIFLWIRCGITIYILPLIFSIAFVVFMYGVIKYVIASDSKEKDEGKKFLMWGIIGLFVMVSVWGIVGLVSNSLGLENTVPQLQQNVYCEGGKKWDPVTQACR